MELESRLRAFAAVARAGSFSQAADALYVSQPAVSKQVAVLEAELGKHLLVRGSRGVTLTPAGRVLADYVLRAEALLANARRALGAGEDAQIGTLSLAASGIPGTYLLPTTLAGFRDLHPGVQLDFRMTTSAGALELVRAHEVELAIVGGLTLPPELLAEPLVDDELVLVGQPSLGGRRLRPKDLEGLTWVVREEGSATRAGLDTARGSSAYRPRPPSSFRRGKRSSWPSREAPGSRRSADLPSTSSCARERLSSWTCRVGACGGPSRWSRPVTSR
jgi:DNA-binding transcriptional LysR family regulator